MKEIIALQLRNIRMGKGYSQKAVALELDMKPNAYSKIERGEVEVTASRLQQIATFFNVPITDFFRHDNLPKLNEPHKEYGFATKGDLEEVERMVQHIMDELNQLKTELGVLSLQLPVQKSIGTK